MSQNLYQTFYCW